jgi:hypothetical protein
MLPKIKLSQKGKWKEAPKFIGRIIMAWASQRLRKRQVIKMMGIVQLTAFLT